jgi:hypothetical protein
LDGEDQDAIKRTNNRKQAPRAGGGYDALLIEPRQIDKGGASVMPKPHCPVRNMRHTGTVEADEASAGRHGKCFKAIHVEPDNALISQM